MGRIVEERASCSMVERLLESCKSQFGEPAGESLREPLAERLIRDKFEANSKQIRRKKLQKILNFLSFFNLKSLNLNNLNDVNHIV